MSDVFGTIVSRWQVEQAVLGVLQQPPPAPASQPRLVYYLADVERQTGLSPRTLPVPPGPNSYRGGIDANTMMAEWFPMVTVIAQSVGAPDYLDRYTVAQGYQVRVIATVGDDSEDTARMVADAYGAAVAKAILDAGSLGGLATNTRLTGSPSTAPLDATDARQVLRSTVTFETLIAPVFTQGTPAVWATDPYVSPAAAPTVQTVSTTVTAEPI